MANDGGSDEDLLAFIRKNYRLVVLTADETMKIDRLKITADRIVDAGIELHKLGSAEHQ